MSQIHDTLMSGGPGGGGRFQPTKRINTGMDESPDFRLLRELDRLQDSLDVTIKPGRRRVLSFMGAVVGEGTTALALHYAFFLARGAEQDVLLVDSDMAHSSEGLSDGVEELPGLAEVLRGETDPAQVVLGTEEPRLHFLPAGKETSRHAELVHSPRFGMLLEALGRRYQTVILDTPPVIAYPESSIIGSMCDGVVFVIHARRTRREIIQKAISSLTLAKCRILGTVLNKRVHDIPGFIYQRI
jgi:tyrosine-protein kinase Etk/Wzc